MGPSDPESEQRKRRKGTRVGNSCSLISTSIDSFCVFELGMGGESCVALIRQHLHFMWPFGQDPLTIKHSLPPPSFLLTCSFQRLSSRVLFLFVSYICGTIFTLHSIFIASTRRMQKISKGPFGKEKG